MSFIHSMNSIPIMLNGTAYIPPATAVNYVPWTIVGFIFQYLIRKRHFGWWSKYNCTSFLLTLSQFPSNHTYTIPDVLSAALDCGTAIGTLLVFFCLQFPRNNTIGADTIQRWWGNTVYQNTADWHARPLRTVAPGQHFGCVPEILHTHARSSLMI